jgi:hypothetical protein
MSARTQITLDPELQRRAHAKAAELGLSFAEYVRRLVAQDLGEPKPKADISLLFDLGASHEATDIARNKDKMIGEAFWADNRRKVKHKTSGRPRQRSRPSFGRR